MAINKQPIARKCRSFDVSPAVMGYGNKKSTRNPGGNKRKKVSEYGMQLKEKQKVKFVYGVLEKQFHKYYLKAANQKGMTGENLLKLIERRLDNVVYRMGMAESRTEARQLVLHEHFELNGRKVNIPSIIVKAGDVVTVRENFRGSEKCKALVEALKDKTAPKWLEVNKDNLTAKVVALPEREDIDFPIEEQLIVELYSK